MTPLRLQEILSMIQTHFETKFRTWEFWCEAEVLSCKIVKGRVYVELAEYDNNHVLIASMKWIMREEELLAVFLQAHGMIAPQELVGQTILFQATCWFHPQRWLSLRIHALSHTFTRGKLLEQKEQLRIDLKNRDLYTKNTTTHFGLPPVRLAIISAYEAEWLRDFIMILEDSPWNMQWEVFPATMHGEPAKTEVAQQLEHIHKQADLFTAVVITRGWWAKEWLAWQNDARIAELICLMPIPVIIATGHTTDTSLLDEIVRYAAKTPSDAAHVILDWYEQLSARLDALQWIISQKVQSRMDRLGDEVAWLRSGIRLLTKKQRQTITERLDFYRQWIQAHEPSLQTHRGFALVRDETGSLITADRVKKVRSWDRLHIEVWWSIIDVFVE